MHWTALALQPSTGPAELVVDQQTLLAPATGYLRVTLRSQAVTVTGPGIPRELTF